MMLKGKKIILGITGGIAAYKSAYIVRLLVKAGAEVRVIFTPSAHKFVTTLTFSTLSKNPVLTEFTDGTTGEWNSHVDLGLWADLIVIAPATANTMAKMAEGRSDNLLTAVYLSARCPVIVAPAMDLDMFRHKTTRTNLSKLKASGVSVIPPSKGDLASGLSGEGRMEEPEQIIRVIEATIHNAHRLDGRRILVTAGPTFEAIDPVRFIGNHSSGKMGYAIAQELLNRGAEVILVSGPVSLELQHARLKKIDVVTADEMLKSCSREFPSVHAGIFAAAVADYRPKKVATKKIRKEDGLSVVELVETKDIISVLGAKKKKGQVMIGFALETDHAIANAKKKLKRKSLDMIVLNVHNNLTSGFGTDTNEVTILDSNGNSANFDVKPKTEVASDIIDQLELKLKKVK